MVKNFLPNTKHHLPIAIKKNYEAGMKPKEIAKLFGISKQRVNYWIHTSLKRRIRRRTKLTRKEITVIPGVVRQGYLQSKIGGDERH